MVAERLRALRAVALFARDHRHGLPARVLAGTVDDPRSAVDLEILPAALGGGSVAANLGHLR
jgi:hypothetical protein